jgi:type I restriction enzyme M protein
MQDDICMFILVSIIITDFFINYIEIMILKKIFYYYKYQYNYHYPLLSFKIYFAIFRFAYKPSLNNLIESIKMTPKEKKFLKSFSGINGEEFNFESYLLKSANILRGHIDASDFKGYIFPLLFYKRTSDVYDEEYEKALNESNGDAIYAGSNVNHRFQIPFGCHWNDLRKITKNVGSQIQKCMRKIEKANPETLYGIFGDVNWRNKERLSDETLVNLIEHFSSLKLSTESVPDDLMGIGYEYLIKKFADDSGHTAAEFYTNRTVVSLMTRLLEPQSYESVYDPTCGTGGMLLECINYLKNHQKDARTLKLFGQEKNLMTSGIARINMLLHGFEDAKIKRGDVLVEPKFIVKDELQKFDVILANPPYSIKKCIHLKLS